MKQLILIIGVVAYSTLLSAQTTKTQWSDKQKYNHYREGMLSEVIGSNSQYVYALFEAVRNSSVFTGLKMDVKLVSFDKETMKRSKSVDLHGFAQDYNDRKSMKRKKINNIFINENSVFVIWTGKKDKYTEVYAQLYDKTLKPQGELKVLYSGLTETARKNRQSIDILTNKDIKDKFYVIAETQREKSENIKIEYVAVDYKLNVSTINKITLPFKKSLSESSISNIETASNRGHKSTFGYETKGNGKQTPELTGEYVLAADGNIYLSHVIRLDKGDRKELVKNEKSKINYFNTILTVTNELINIPLKHDGKNLFQVNKTYSKNGVAIAGFYSDLNLDRKGEDLHGIYYGEFNSMSKIMVQSHFIDFDKETLAKLYSNDREDKKKEGILKGKKAKESNAESLKNDYVIEHIIENNNNELILFGSRMINYSKVTTTTTAGKSTSKQTTQYFCEKRNVTAFKIKKEGTLVWATNVDRSKTYYNMQNVYDIDVETNTDKTNYKLSYGSTYELGASSKNVLTAKNKGLLFNPNNAPKEKIIMNDADGSFRKDITTEKEDEAIFKTPEKDYRRKIGDVKYVFDNETYVTSGSYKPQLWKFLVMLPVFPLLYIPAVRRHIGKGSGYIGKVIVEESKKKGSKNKK